jgi:hypothetical protein
MGMAERPPRAAVQPILDHFGTTGARRDDYGVVAARISAVIAPAICANTCAITGCAVVARNRPVPLGPQPTASIPHETQSTIQVNRVNLMDVFSLGNRDQRRQTSR